MKASKDDRQARDERNRARLDEKIRREQERRAVRDRGEEGRPRREPKIERLIADFREMTDANRALFLNAITSDIGIESLIALHAAMPPRPLDYDRAAINLRVTTKRELFRLRGCAKEPFTVDWIHAEIGAGEVFYDIGANVGVYSLVAAKKPDGGARVFSFEPGYASYASLCSNVMLNGLAGQVTPLPVALSDRTAMQVFRLGDTEPGAAHHVLGPAMPGDEPAAFEQPVIMFRLDDLVEQFRLPLPNHIKLDVDGGELDVLNGASRTLSSPALRSMLVEVSTAQSGAVSDVLDRHGLALRSKVSVINKAGDADVWYGLFARVGTGAAMRAAGDAAVSG